MKATTRYSSNPNFLWMLIACVILVGGLVTVFISQLTQTSTTVTKTHSSLAAPVLGVTVDLKLQVLDVEVGSAAATAGLQRGDVLTALDNVKVSDNIEMKKLFREKVQSYLANSNQTNFSAGVIGPNVTLSFTRGTQALTINAAIQTPIKTGNTSGSTGPAPTSTAVPSSQDYF